MNAAVAFHDAECHAYRADLPLWRGLAMQAAGPVLDVGAGTGRVALDLAEHGHAVTALDSDAGLLAALTERAVRAGLDVATVVADAEALPDGLGPFPLVLVPMQTVQLLGDRPAFFAGARRVLAPGGLLALAIADELTAFSEEPGIELPAADVVEAEGWRFESQPVAVRLSPAVARIERIRTVQGPDGTRTSADDAIDLRRVDAPTLTAEGAAAGLLPAPGHRIPPTEDHVGSAVVLLRG